MSQEPAKPKCWTKPRVKRLGVIADVAGIQLPKAQASGAVKS